MALFAKPFAAVALLFVQGSAQGMQALVATSPAEHDLVERALPGLGYLHKIFTDLPDSCEVLVAVRASSVNPSDRSTPGPFPQVMGSDLAGEVLKVGSDCKRLKVGDRVWADIGANAHVRAKKVKENGAYAQVAVALESQLGPMPQNVDFAEAGSLPKVALTSYKALAWYGGAPFTSSNGTVLILGGSGGTGIAGIQIAKALGASAITTTTSAGNADFVKSLGATSVIDYKKSNWWDVLAHGSVDVIFDTVGQTGTGDRAMPLLKAGGFYVTIVGALPSSPREDVHSNMFINSDTNLDNFDLLERLRLLVEADKLRMSRRFSYPLSNISGAFAESSTGHVNGKLVVEMPHLQTTQQFTV